MIGLLIVSAVSHSGDAANLGGYTVEPVRPGMYTGTPLETTEVSFWQLPPQVIILSLALTISPLLEYLIELLLFTRFCFYILYRKITRGNLLQNETRDRIFQCIRENPGIFFNAIARKTGITPGTLRYHLILLSAMKKISILDSMGNTRYFENSGRFSETEKSVLKYVRNETDSRILQLIRDYPDLNRRELGETLGISGVMVTWYTKRLSAAGIIMLQKTGKNTRYEINPEVRDYLEKYLVRNNDLPVSVSYEPVAESG